ncbi:hypothetical protein FPQ18DRAFT_84392 [Pyronema domesticum]|uniref:DUF7598 domain-containing protein n=1 Tax=Pyronema omphalodes (strain CBS 100304) TaxID=1076935 RepID=U4L7E6_PYROM|nr:hypothetical protein FPQ18DRAFT_84392 [Pyronema domesticum]CCX05935.1 Similar to hypothetical protein M7I_6233 [Glarea lozoyensis 74030]; acc. no. EHK98000 [Pyronema omphalodes CBS 100304]
MSVASESDLEKQPTRESRQVPHGFWLLNLLRVCSVVSLLSGFVASWATLVKSFGANKFFFFDATGHILLSSFCTFLIITQCSIFPSYFKTNWPVFARDASLVWQGLGEIGVGISLLANLNEEVASKDILGNSFNTLIIASGACLCLFGLLTVAASFVFSGSSVTARMARSIGNYRKVLNEHKKGKQRAMEISWSRNGSTPSIRSSIGTPAIPPRTYSGGQDRRGSDTSSVYSIGNPHLNYQNPGVTPPAAIHAKPYQNTRVIPGPSRQPYPNPYQQDSSRRGSSGRIGEVV